MKNTQHLIRIQAENFRKLKVVDFKPNRYITKVSGANGAGKTSALDAILRALDPRKTVDAKELRTGERRGGIRVETDTHIITRRLDENGGSLTIEDKATNTLVKEPVDWLEMVAGNLGYDPLEFMRMTGEQQAEKLKGIVKLDVDIDEIEEKNAEDALIIRAKKIQRNDLEARRDGINVDPLLPTEPIDIDELLKEARGIAENNRKIESEERGRQAIRNDRDAAIRDMEDRQKRIAAIREELNQLHTELADASKDLDSLNKDINSWKPLPKLEDAFAVEDRISKASATNTQVTANNAARDQKDRLTTEIEALDTEVSHLRAIVSDRKQTAAKTLETANFPVPGLSFVVQTEGSNGQKLKHPKRIVTYNGIPLTDASTGEQIRVSAAIGMAGKPELRFLLIREGSLLDDNGMAILEKMAHEHDWQILMEIVDQSGKVGVYLEDGEIKAVNQEQEPEPAAAAPKRRTTKKKAEQGKMKYGDEAL